MTRILVAVDGSPAADAAVEKAVALAKSRDQLTVLCVVDFTHYILAQPLAVETNVNFTDLKARMIEQGNTVIEKYKKIKPDSALSEVDYQFELLQGNPREVIVQQTIDKKIDTLVIGQVGLASTKSTSVGSTAEYCLRNCPCDVLICKLRPDENF
eukprot:TRINITY_DN2453_c0_g1_i1.p1 TRINITY_DN2453_c0_g1~~TRINITY_DN2453_c0_g1_i1.p1  ORF type:complete len:155 (+),score=48.18 TRINITY_DN2453_c0_g1_i1:43-507(+)